MSAIKDQSTGIILRHYGSPEDVVFAERNTLYIDLSTGLSYVKTTGRDTAGGWQEEEGGEGGGSNLTHAAILALSGATSTETTLTANTSGVITLATGGSGSTHTLPLPTGATDDIIERRLEIASGSLRAVVFKDASNNTIESYTATGAESAGFFQLKKTASGWVRAGSNTVPKPDASQAEAEAGTATNVAMTPQRTAQAIAALAPGGGGGGYKSGKAYAWTADGTLFTEYSTIDAAVKAAVAAGGDVYVPPSVTPIDQQWQGHPSVRMFIDADIAYTGIGPVVMEPPAGSFGLYKMSTHGLISKVVSDAATRDSEAAGTRTITSFSSADGWTTFTTSTDHGLPLYSYVSISGLSGAALTAYNAIKYHDGHVTAEALTATTFRVKTNASISGTGTFTMTKVEAEHVARISHYDNHFDLRGYNAKMSVNAARTNSNNYSVFKVRGGIVHAHQFHAVDGDNCSVLHMVTGNPDILSDRIQSTGTGISTLVFDGDYTDRSPEDQTSRCWTTGERLTADPAEAAIRYRGNHKTVIAYHTHRTVEGRIQGAGEWTSGNTSIILPVLQVALLTSRYGLVSPPTHTDPLLWLDAQGASSIEVAGFIGAIKTPNGPSVRLRYVHPTADFSIGRIDFNATVDNSVFLEGPHAVRIGTILGASPDMIVARLRDGAGLIGTQVYGQVQVEDDCMLDGVRIRLPLDSTADTVAPVESAATITALGVVASLDKDINVSLHTDSSFTVMPQLAPGNPTPPPLPTPTPTPTPPPTPTPTP